MCCAWAACGPSIFIRSNGSRSFGKVEFYKARRSSLRALQKMRLDDCLAFRLSWGMNSSKISRADLRVAVAGMGPIGRRVVEALDDGIDGLVLSAVSVQSPEKHRSWLGKLKSLPAILSIDSLSEVADIVVECAPAKLLRSI